MNLRVTPRASRAELTGFQDGTLRLRTTASPVHGKANEECIRIIADFFGIRKSQVRIVSGHASRTKTIAVDGADAGEITARLARLTPAKGIRNS